MFIKVDLNKYTELGGKLDKLDLSKTRTVYNDMNNSKKIIRITAAPLDNMFHVLFEGGGVEYKYAGMWIYTHVEFVLSTKYKGLEEQLNAFEIIDLTKL